MRRDWYGGSGLGANEPAYLRPGPVPDVPTMVRGAYWLGGAASDAPREVFYWWSHWEEPERQSLRAEVGGRPLWIEDEHQIIWGFELEVPWRLLRQGVSHVYRDPIAELRALLSVKDSLSWINVPADTGWRVETVAHLGRPALAISGSHGRYRSLELVRDDATGLVLRIASDQVLGAMVLETTSFALVPYEPEVFTYDGPTRPYDGPRVHPLPTART